VTNRVRNQLGRRDQTNVYIRLAVIVAVTGPASDFIVFDVCSIWNAHNTAKRPLVKGISSSTESELRTYFFFGRTKCAQNDTRL